MATKKKASSKKASKKQVNKVNKVAKKKKPTKSEPLDFTFLVEGKASGKDSFDVQVKCDGNVLSAGVALGQLMVNDKEINKVIEVAVNRYLAILNKKEKPIKSIKSKNGK